MKKLFVLLIAGFLLNGTISMADDTELLAAEARRQAFIENELKDILPQLEAKRNGPSKAGTPFNGPEYKRINKAWNNWLTENPEDSKLLFKNLSSFDTRHLVTVRNGKIINPLQIQAERAAPSQQKINSASQPKRPKIGKWAKLGGGFAVLSAVGAIGYKAGTAKGVSAVESTDTTKKVAPQLGGISADGEVSQDLTSTGE